MIDDILQLVTEILVIIDSETSVQSGTDWSSLAANQKEDLATVVLDEAFKGAITGKTAGQATPRQIFWSVMKKYELNDDELTFFAANQWITGRIPAYEDKYNIGWEERYSGSLLQGGPLAIQGWFKQNWITVAGILIASIVLAIYGPKFIKKYLIK